MPECLWNVQIGKNLEFDEENWKKYINVSKKSIFGQTYMRLAVAMETSKWCAHNWHIKTFTKDEWTATESFSP